MKTMASAKVSGEGLAAARTKFEGKLQSAKAALADASQPLRDKTREGAAAADGCVRGNPWTAPEKRQVRPPQTIYVKSPFTHSRPQRGTARRRPVRPR